MRIDWKRLLILFCVAAIAVNALELPTQEPDGSWKIGNMTLQPAVANRTWRWAGIREPRIEEVEGERRFTGEITCDGVPGTLNWTLRKSGENRYRFQSFVRFTAPAESRAVCMNLTLPLPTGKLTVDGSEIPIPSAYDNMVLRAAAPAESLSIGFPGGFGFTVAGKLNLYVQDNRRWRDTVSVRIYFTPGEGEIREAEIAFDLAFSPGPVPETREKAVTLGQGERWRELHFERRILAGSPLDFSRFQDAPAGKYGFIRSDAGGRLTFENAPSKQIRLYGTNLCMSANFLDNETVDELASYFVRMGYNALRLHHHDNGLVSSESADSVTLDPDRLDRLDYLFAKMKESGIFITTDLYTSRMLKAGDGISDYGRGQVLKGLLPLEPRAMENWKTFARRWMEHRNPYTGMTWGEDPALVCLNLVNEETLSNCWNRFPELEKRYLAKFKESGESKFHRFLNQLQAKVLEEQIDFFKNELRLKTMVTSLNYLHFLPLTLLRDRFDLVDNHQYFAHPDFPEKSWSLPHRYDQGSAIRRGALLPRVMMPTRIFGKPFFVTEFNYCNPNIHRAEGGPLIGAYAALQDWGGLWRFAWSHSADAVINQRPGGTFNAANDPMQQFSDRIILMLFRRGDLTPAKAKYSYPVSADAPEREFPESFSELGLNAQIGSHPAGKPLPEGVALYRPGTEVAADPRLKLDREAGTFAVITPLTESVTLPGGNLAAGLLKIENADAFMTVAALSLDGEPLARSRSVLLIHLTNITTTGIRFRDRMGTLLEDWGKLPHLIERGRATVELPGQWRVAALAADGEELGMVAEGVSRFEVDSCGFEGGVLAYHLTR